MAEKTVDNELYDNHGEIELAGSANAYTATTARAITGYYKGLRICGKANHTNNGASTLNVNGLGASAIRLPGNAALTGGEIVSGGYYDFNYDAANSVFQLQNAAAAASISNAQLANMAQSTIKGRAEGAGTGAPQDLTPEQARDVLGLDTDDTPTFASMTIDGAGPSDPILTISGTSGNPKIEIGRVDGSASLPHVDFHSGATAVDYDVRVIASGGSGANGGGDLAITSAALTHNSVSLVPLVRAVAAGAVSSAATLDIPLGSADMYEIDLINIAPATDGQEFFARFSQSGSFLSGASDYNWNIVTNGANSNDAADSEMRISDNCGNAANELTTVTLRIYRPSASAFAKTMIWHGKSVTATPTLIETSGGGQLLANTNAIDGVRFMFASGNIASGYYAVRSYSFT